jgi:hypothetical protein
MEKLVRMILQNTVQNLLVYVMRPALVLAMVMCAVAVILLPWV